MRLKAHLIAIGVAAGLVIIAAGPANARSEWSTPIDSRQDSVYGINIKRSTLDVRKAGFYRIKIFGYKFVRRYLNVATLRLDTVRSNPGPEYLVTWGMPYDGVFLSIYGTSGIQDGNDYRATLQRVDTWFNQDIDAKRMILTQQPAAPVACPRMRLYKHLEKGVVSFWIPRRCVGRPSNVRWNVETQRVNTYGNEFYDADIDAAPGIRMFTRWVA